MDDSIKIYHLCHNDNSSKAAIGLIVNLWCDPLISIEDLTAKRKQQEGKRGQKPLCVDSVSRQCMIAVMLRNRRGGRILCFKDDDDDDE